MTEFSAKSAMEVRLFMEKLGWDSRDSLCVEGWGNGHKYSVWFERYEWHGRNVLALTGHEVCFHKHTNNLQDIDEVTRICANQALKAYSDYTNCVPFQNADGETSEDTMLRDWDDPKALLDR